MNQSSSDLQRKAQKALLDDRLTKKHGIDVLIEVNLV